MDRNAHAVATEVATPDSGASLRMTFERIFQNNPYPVALVDHAPGVADMVSALGAVGLEPHQILERIVELMGPDILSECEPVFGEYILTRARMASLAPLLDVVGATDPKVANAWLVRALTEGACVRGDAFFPSGDIRLDGRDWVEALPPGLEYPAALDLSRSPGLVSLPESLRVAKDFNLHGCGALPCLPDEVQVGGHLDLRQCGRLASVGSDLRVGKHFLAHGCTALERVGERLSVRGDVGMEGCVRLKAMPRRMRVGGNLNLRGCTDLASIPCDTLDIGKHLLLEGCAALTVLPRTLTVRLGLHLDGCVSLRALPDNLSVGQNLSLKGCAALRRLPEGLTVGHTLDLRGCASWDGVIPEGTRVGGRILTKGDA